MKPRVGVILADLKLKRPIGDFGHTGTFHFPVFSETMDRPEDSLPTLKTLEQKGAKAIISEVPLTLPNNTEQNIPIYTTSLVQLPMLIYTIPGTIGVLAATETEIHPKLLHSLNITYPISTSVMDDMPAFTESYITKTRPLDSEAVAFEMNFVTQRLLKNNPALKAILLANPHMTAYRHAIRKVTDIPIFDFVTLAAYIHHSLND